MGGPSASASGNDGRSMSGNGNGSNSTPSRRRARVGTGSGGLLTRWSVRESNNAQMETTILDCERAISRQRTLEGVLTGVEMRDPPTLYLYLTLREASAAILDDLDALRKRHNSGRLAQFTSAYRTQRLVDGITGRCKTLHDALHGAEVHAACVARLNALCALCASRPEGSPLAIADAMHAVYAAARDVSSAVNAQIRTHDRKPPKAVAVELIVAKVCGNNQHLATTVRTRAVERDGEGDEEESSSRNDIDYTAFVAGSIDHDANSLNALVVVGPAESSD